jgi:hypothetical protein
VIGTLATNKSSLARGVSHCGLVSFTLKSILRQKKNYENSNISPGIQKHNLQKNPLKETKILQDIIKPITNLKFQDKPKYHLSKILL